MGSLKQERNFGGNLSVYSTESEVVFMNNRRVFQRLMACSVIFLSSLLASCAGASTLPTLLPGEAGPAQSNPSPVVSKSVESIPTQPALRTEPAVNPVTPVSSPSSPGSTAAPSQPVLTGPTSESPLPTVDPLQGLQKALAIVDQQMKAAESSASLEQARAHAEIAVNVLVGYWGIGYGDGDGDGKIDDANSRYGVLPAGRIQESAPGTGAAYTQLGWAILVDETLGTNANQSVQTLLGDTQAWKNDAAGSYRQIDAAIQATNGSHDGVSSLGGQVPQAAAWARLILIKAQTLDEAKLYAGRGAQVTGVVLQTAGQIH